MTFTTDDCQLWFNPFDFKVLETGEDEEEKMQIVSANWFSVLETSTTDDGGHLFNSFDFKS